MSVMAITVALLLLLTPSSLPRLTNRSFRESDWAVKLDQHRPGLFASGDSPITGWLLALRSGRRGLGLSWASAACMRMCVWVCVSARWSVCVCGCLGERGLPATFTKFQQQCRFHNILCKSEVRVCWLENTCVSKCAHVFVCTVWGGSVCVCVFMCVCMCVWVHMHSVLSLQWVSSGAWWSAGIIRFCILSQRGHAKKGVKVCVWVCLCVRGMSSEMWGWPYLSFLHSSPGITGPRWLLPLFFHPAHVEEASASLITSGVVCCCWKFPWCR